MSDYPDFFKYAEKLTLLGVLALIVYVMYKRDLEKDKRFLELQQKIFEMEKNQLAALNDLTEALNRNTDATEKLLVHGTHTNR